MEDDEMSIDNEIPSKQIPEPEPNEKIFMKKLEVKHNMFQNEFEKQLSRLPDSLRFIKKFIYYQFLPGVDRVITELEHIKQTPNYDENLPSFKPISEIELNHSVTCIDMFETHNIKKTKFPKAILGTLSGNLVIYDFELNRNIIDKNISKNGRIELLASASIKYYDSYITRIAVCCRGEPIIYTYAYNHSFATINLEYTINLNKNNNVPGDYPLEIIPAEIKLSNDTFFLYVIDFAGGIRIFKFMDIPKQGTLDSNTVGVVADIQKPTKTGSSNKLAQVKPAAKDEKTQEKKQEDVLLIYQNKYLKKENFLPFDIKKPEEINPKDKKIEKKKEPEKKKIDPKAPVIEKVISEDNYNIKSQFDESGCDISEFQKFSKNKPFVNFIQKKLIFEEKTGGGFATALVTIGAYLSYANTTSLKFISLYNYLTDNMKNSFKVVKTKGIGTLSQDESMMLNAGLPKGEREFLSFLKSKIEQINTNSQPSNSSQQNSVINQNTNYEKMEVNFNLLYDVSVMALQSKFDDNINYLGLGMKEGSIVVWDVELHTEKYFFQDNNSEIVSLIIDSNFLTSGSLDGKVYIYSMMTGEALFNCYHNSYKNYPLQSVNYTIILK